MHKMSKEQICDFAGFYGKKTTVDSLYCGHPCVHIFLSTVDRVSTLRRVMNINELGQKVLKVKVVSSVNSLDLSLYSQGHLVHEYL